MFCRKRKISRKNTARAKKQTVKRITGKETKALPNAITAKATRGFRLSDKDINVDKHNAYYVEEILTCTHIISQILASCSWKVKRKVKKSVVNPQTGQSETGTFFEEAKDLPIWFALKHQINELTTAYDFFYSMVRSMLKDKARAIFYYDANGNKAGAFQVDADALKLIQDKTSKEYVWEYNPEGKEAAYFEYKDVLNLLFMPDNTADGFDFIEAGKQTFEITKCSTAFARKFFKEGLYAEASYTYDLELSRAQINDAKDEISRKIKGTNSEGFVLLPKGFEGGITYPDVSKTQLNEVRNFNRESIYLFYRLQSILKSSGNFEDKNLEIWNAILPIVRSIEKKLEFCCLSREQITDGYYVRADNSHFLRTTYAQTISANSQAINNGQRTSAEVREASECDYIAGTNVLLMNSAMQNPNHSANTGGQNEYSENGEKNNV